MTIGVGRNFLSPVSYAHLAQFDEVAAGPLAASLAIDVGGPATLTQADGVFSKSGGKLVFPAQATPVWGDQRLVLPAVTRAAGMAVLGTLNLSTIGNAAILWGSSATPTSGDAAVITSAGLRVDIGGSTGPVVTEPLVTGTDYHLLLVLGSDGLRWYIKGGIYIDWTIVWLSETGTTTPLYPAFLNYDAVGTLDNFRVVDLRKYESRFENTDEFIFTSFVPVAGTSYTGLADAIIDHTLVYASAGFTFRYRHLNTNNNWLVTAGTTGAINLVEVIAGVSNTRDTAPAGTISVGTHRLRISTLGNEHRVFLNDTLILDYSSASYKTNTTVRFTTLAANTVTRTVIRPRVPYLKAI